MERGLGAGPTRPLKRPEPNYIVNPDELKTAGWNQNADLALACNKAPM
jgi:hypothetical protein